MTDLLIDGAGGNDPRRLLAEAWDHHVSSSRADRPNAVAPLRWLEARLSGDESSGWRPHVRLPDVSVPRVSLPHFSMPRLAAPEVDQARLTRALFSACALLVVLAVAALGSVPARTPGAADLTASPALAAKLSPLSDNRAAALAATGLLPRNLARAASQVRQLPPIVPSARGALPGRKGHVALQAGAGRGR